MPFFLKISFEISQSHKFLNCEYIALSFIIILYFFKIQSKTSVLLFLITGPPKIIDRADKAPKNPGYSF